MMVCKKLGKEIYIAEIALYNIWMYENMKSQISVDWKTPMLLDMWIIGDL